MVTLGILIYLCLNLDRTAAENWWVANIESLTRGELLLIVIVGVYIVSKSKESNIYKNIKVVK